jgi:hypothetical protein
MAFFGSVALLTATLGLQATAADDPLEIVDRSNLVWEIPSADAFGSVPLGNGDVALNAWVEPGGDLVFYISKTDSWGDNGRLLKVGRVRIGLEPSPLPEGAAFQQTLRLRDATLEAHCGRGDDAATLRLWVDANRPVVHVSVDSKRPLAATARIELWRTEPFELPSIECSDIMLDRSKPGSMHAPTVVEPDTVLANQSGRIGWYHHNVKSVGPELTMRLQGLGDCLKVDPLLGRTFGAIVKAAGAQRVDDRTLRSPAATSHRFDVYVLTRHPAKPDAWLEAMDGLIAEVEQTPAAERRAAHEKWWADFWGRSWIDVTSNGEAKRLALIPANTHPMKIGVDQAGGNVFRGQLGRVSILQTALSDKEIEQLARTEHGQALGARPGLLWTSAAVEPPQTLAKSEGWGFPEGMTIEAWVKPEKLPGSGARIVDKIRPGGSDGFLLDTFPGNSVRLIVGDAVLTKENVLPAGQWSHVAAVVDGKTGGIKLYVGGAPVGELARDALDDAAVVSRGYALQRFVTACAGRGAYPIKFNGSIFTMPNPGSPGDADYRRWGPGYWWQNTRLPYISMCASGDYDLMQPLIQMYVKEVLPICRVRTERCFGHEGAFFPECIYFWGAVFSETYGWTPFDQREDKLQASGWHKWEWVCGPELTAMLFDYYDHTLDEAFLRETLLPTAHDVLVFFDRHYRTNDQGKLVMHPAQALETWWDCTDPMPELAGLYSLTERLLALPENLTTAEQRAFWTALRKKLPELPTREVDGVRVLSPAATFAAKRNIENPELYAVFPFRLVAVGRPGLELGIEALKHRTDRGDFGWRQDDIFMAYLGLADDARKNVAGRARRRDVRCRFPAFWGPNYDWTPDQDHGGVLMRALQAMVLQTDGRKIYLLPAWPKDWNVRFRLHAPCRTAVEGEFRDGKLLRWNVTPESRRADVVVLGPSGTAQVPPQAPGVFTGG